MAQAVAPNEPQRNLRVVDDQGNWTQHGLELLRQIWRQGVAGFVNNPCNADGTNDLVLTPQLHSEGGATLADGMSFSCVIPATSTGPVTVKVKGQPTALVVSADGGLTQAGAGDLVANTLAHFHYVAGLDGGNGGFVVK